MKRVYIFVERLKYTAFPSIQDIDRPALNYFNSIGIPIKHIEYNLVAFDSFELLTVFSVSLKKEDASWIVLSRGFELVISLNIIEYYILFYYWNIYKELIKVIDACKSFYRRIFD